MKFCLVGEKLKHSYSADIHKNMGIDYCLQEVDKDNFAYFVKNNEFSGFNVTIPYKKDIIPLLDFVSEDAEKIGAVNTVLKKGDLLFGYNTDIFGIENTFLNNSISVSNKNVVILGTGGTSNSCEYYCKKNNALSIIKISRSGEINYQNCYERCKNANILINCTPCGMFPNVEESIIDLSKFKSLEFVFDCIYNPLRTNLILQAKQLKIKYSNGINMLVSQALYSENIWLNKKNTNYTKKSINALLKEKENIVLYGMPSCGKSTIGKRLAKILKKDFIDTDILIEQKIGKKPSEIIIDNGEQYFRQVESEIIKEISFFNGKIISVGGGTVINNENVKNLMRNGVLFYIKRDLSLLSSKDRPISKSVGVENLYNQRKDVYESIFDYCISNNFDIDSCVKGIIKCYENFGN